MDLRIEVEDDDLVTSDWGSDSGLVALAGGLSLPALAAWAFAPTVWAAAVTLWVVFAIFGAWVSVRRARPYWEGLICAAILGPLGVVLAAVLPETRRG